MKQLILTLLLMVGCGGPSEPLCLLPGLGPEAAYIIGGQPSTDRRSTVQVWVTGGYCTGTIIGPHTALTAAHCQNPQEILVEGIAWYAVSEYLSHPLYSFPRHDLQLLYFEETMPPPYAELWDPTAGCFTAIAQGYGFGSAGALHERAVTVFDRGSGILRATEGICNGDSGGPLWVEAPDGTMLAGVSSFGFGIPRVCDGTTGFVDLTSDGNPEWVKENIR